MYPERKRERFLTDAEFERLGDVLKTAQMRGGASESSMAAIRLLLLTGCRKSEILTLRWEHVDLPAAQLHLPDTKTGARTVSLPVDAVKVLEELPGVPGNPWVIVGRKPGTHLKSLDVGWRTLRSRAGLEDVRIHDLRHSYASRALALGGKPANDREAAGPQTNRDHGTVCAPGGRFGARLGGAHCREPCRGHGHHCLVPLNCYWREIRANHLTGLPDVDAPAVLMDEVFKEKCVVRGVAPMLNRHGHTNLRHGIRALATTGGLPMLP